MRKKIKISTAIPASMSEFEQTSNPHLTSAKLKVFHKGRTGDGRYFTKTFADKLAATIGGTPVVARYDEEAKDFIGHASEQSVFGFVPEEPRVWTELDENGNSWLTTEVRLFTERHDVGTIAKKIIGHSQSLELDPSSVEVNFVYENEQDERPLIEFVDGNLIGLSVLGVDQEPAFTGSGFFELTTTEALEELIAKYVSIPSEIVMETGGEDMNKVIIFEGDGFTIFMKDNRIYVETQAGTLDDISDALESAQATEEVEETEATEEEVEETEEEADEVIEALEEPEEEPEEPEIAEEAEEESAEAEEPEETPAEQGDGANEGDEGGEDFESEDAEEEKPEEEKAGVEPETTESSANASTLSEEEREELNNYRREHKISIIKGYAKYLTESQLKEFKERVDEFDFDSLEKELSFAGMNNVRKEEETNNKPTFGFIPTNSKKDKDEMSNIIGHYNEVK